MYKIFFKIYFKKFRFPLLNENNFANHKNKKICQINIRNEKSFAFFIMTFSYWKIFHLRTYLYAHMFTFIVASFVRVRTLLCDCLPKRILPYRISLSIIISFYRRIHFLFFVTKEQRFRQLYLLHFLLIKSLLY